MAGGFHLAQVNIGRILHPLDAPEIADFAKNLDPINAQAESQPGFLWRLVGDDGNATDIRPDAADQNLLINMSLWSDIESLAAFVYRSRHREFMRRRSEWFAPMSVYQALWWVPRGERPVPAEGLARVRHLQTHGPTPDAFTFKTPFPAPGATVGVTPILEECA